MVLPYWNALSFFTTYAVVDGFQPGESKARPIAERPQVPSVFDLAQTAEQREVINLFVGADDMGHPIALPPA